MRNAVTLFVVLLTTTMAGFLAKAQTQILPTVTGFTFTSGVGIGTGSVVSVTPPTGATFTQAWDITITHADSFHDARLWANTTQSVAKGDALVVTVWYRRVDGLSGSVMPGEAELFLNNYTGTTSPVTSLYTPLRGRNQWRQVTMPFIAATAGVMTVEIDCAALLQEVQIGGIQMTDYGQKSVLTTTPNVIDCTSQFTDFGYQNGATGTEDDDFCDRQFVLHHGGPDQGHRGKSIR